MLPSQQLEQRRQRLARLAEERDSQLASTSARPSPQSTPAPAPRRTVSSLPGEKTCWICYETSLESPHRPFIHACNCTLLAHPDCLLEWISTRPSTSSTTSPRCPVCATLIIVTQDQPKFLKIYRNSILKLHKLSIVATLGGIAASGWFVASAYGMWALRVFMGDRVANALLERNYSRGIPFRLWLNLPLIPFALILSRTPLIDSLLPFLPLTLALSSSHASHSTSLTPFDPLGLSDLSLHYPPSPTLTICLIPWFRILYFRTRERVFEKVLGKQKRFRGLAGMMEEAARDEMDTWDVLDDGNESSSEGERRRERGGRQRNGIELVAELEYEYDQEEEEEEEHEEEHEEQDEWENVGGTDHPLDAESPMATPLPGAFDAATPPPAPRHQHRRRRQPRQQAQPAPAPVAPPPSSLRIGIGRLTSLLLGALIYPALSSLVGSALFYLATRRSGRKNPGVLIETLRRVLGVSNLIRASSPVTFSSSIGSSSSVVTKSQGFISSILSFLNPFPSFYSTSSPSSFGFPSLVSGGGRGNSLVDPIWIRNTLGGGIVLLMRDVVQLYVGILEKRRKESRRVVEREVGEGLSLRTGE